MNTYTQTLLRSLVALYLMTASLSHVSQAAYTAEQKWIQSVNTAHTPSTPSTPDHDEETVNSDDDGSSSESELLIANNTNHYEWYSIMVKAPSTVNDNFYSFIPEYDRYHYLKNTQSFLVCNHYGLPITQLIDHLMPTFQSVHDRFGIEQIAKSDTYTYRKSDKCFIMSTEVIKEDDLGELIQVFDNHFGIEAIVVVDRDHRFFHYCKTDKSFHVDNTQILPITELIDYLIPMVQLCSDRYGVNIIHFKGSAKDILALQKRLKVTSPQLSKIVLQLE